MNLSKTHPVRLVFTAARVFSGKSARISALTLFAYFTLTGCSDGNEGDTSSSYSTNSSSTLSSSHSASTTSSASSLSSVSSSSAPAVNHIMINEAAATNTTYEDEEGDTPDWIELYNPTPEAVSLNGWSISDAGDELAKWSFPDISIPAQGFMHIWASDKDRIDLAQAGSSSSTNGTPPTSDIVLHTNFKISNDGETLYLTNASGEIVHTLEVITTLTDMSVGLSPQSQARVLFLEPTPGAGNNSQDYLGIVSSQVTFSHDGGTNTPAQLVLSGATEDEVIHYSTDGTEPTETSPLYAEPLELTQNTVVRARAFRDGYVPSKTTTRTFLPDAYHDLPIISLATDPLNFFDMEYGIYAFGTDYERRNPHYGANFWQDWEREIHFAFYEPTGELAEELDAGVKIFGGWSRARPQRSLAIYARSEYGEGKIRHAFFPPRNYDDFESLVLRNSGNDWMITMLRDVALTSLMDGSGLDTQAYRPSAVYLNGDYWGLYNLREKVSEHFIASKHDLDKDDIDLLEGNAYIVEGSNEEYLELVEYLENNSLENAENYAHVAEQIDIDNFTIYQIAQIYFNNTDWPGNNIKYWKSPTTKWRWILYDTDFGFGIYDEEDVERNTLEHATDDDSREYANAPWSTLLLRRLLENADYRNYFISRFAHEINTRFRVEHVVDLIDGHANVIAAEIPQHFARWEPEMNRDPEDPPLDWASRVQEMKDFAEFRPALMREHIVDFFALDGTYELQIKNENTDSGAVLINQHELALPDWHGVFFAGVPLSISAEPHDGYAFSHWLGVPENMQTEPVLNLSGSETLAIEPVFVPEETTTP